MPVAAGYRVLQNQNRIVVSGGESLPRCHVCPTTMATGRPPNQVHVANGMDCIAARIPALIEKPLADDIVAAQAWSKPPSRRACRC